MNRSYLPFAICYTALIIYASLFPFTGWSQPRDDPFAWLALKLPGHLSKSDLIVNVLAYIPLGFLVAKLFLTSSRRLIPLYLAIMIGCGTSFSMETLQAFLPSRTSSVLDLATNSAGTVFGSLLALFFRLSGGSPAGLVNRRTRYLLPGRLPDLGLAVIICWALSQLAPFFPSVDLGDIKNALKPLWYTLHDLSLFDPAKAAVYAFSIAGLGMVALTAAQERSRVRVVSCFLVFAGLVVCSKIFFTSRQLSLEALAGLALGSVLVAVLFRMPRAWHSYAGIALLMAGFALSELRPGTTAALSPAFNWVPLAGQLGNELNGIGGILEGAWPFAGASYLSLLLLGEQSKRGMTIGGIAAMVLVFGLEWCQLFIPGRTADVTQALIAAAGWFGVLVFLRSGTADQTRRG